MSEPSPSSNIYQNDTCLQLLNTRDQESAYLSAMFGFKVQKLKFYVWPNLLSKTSISAGYVSLCFSASDTKILQDKVQCLTLKPSKYYGYVRSKNCSCNDPCSRLVSRDRKKAIKLAIYKFKLFLPSFHVWSKVLTKTSWQQLMSSPILYSSKQRPESYQIKYNIYVQIVTTHAPCVKDPHLNKRYPLSRSTREHKITRSNLISIFKTCPPWVHVWSNLFSKNINTASHVLGSSS